MYIHVCMCVIMCRRIIYGMYITVCVFVTFRHYFDNAHNAYLLHGDASDLYVIIIDEIDAICKPRGETYYMYMYIIQFNLRTKDTL